MLPPRSNCFIAIRNTHSRHIGSMPHLASNIPQRESIKTEYYYSCEQKDILWYPSPRWCVAPKQLLVLVKNVPSNAATTQGRYTSCRFKQSCVVLSLSYKRQDTAYLECSTYRLHPDFGEHPGRSSTPVQSESHSEPYDRLLLLC